MILEEHRYKQQTSCKSFAKFETVDEIIDWWNRFNNYTLEDYIEIDNIDEIRITIKESPYVVWFQLIRTINKDFDITLIVNDCAYAKLLNSNDFGKFLKIICELQKEN